ncbi:hypothetical protein PG984_015494 [Apiospora sp. TS-2023a]
MHLFSLPAELVQFIVDCSVLSRDHRRMMRLRRVSRQFKMHVDDTIFRLRLFDYRPETRRYYMPIYVSSSSRNDGHADQAYIRFMYSYFAYQVMREQSRVSPLGRIYGAAESLAKLDGETETHAITWRVESLIRLAVTTRLMLLTGYPRAQPESCSEEDLSLDLFVAAVWLGKKEYVAQRIKKRVPPFDEEGLDKGSDVFDSAFKAASIKGNVEMWDLLLSTEREEDRERRQIDVAFKAAIHGHREMFDITFGSTKMTESSPGSLEPLSELIRWPDQFERIKAFLPPVPTGVACEVLILRLMRSVAQEDAEMVRYHLLQGARLELPNFYGYKRTMPLAIAVEKGDEATVRILIEEGGADPSWPEWCDTELHQSPVALAVWKGSAALTHLLLDYGANPNAGSPPALVIAVFLERPDLFRLLRDRGASLDTPWAGPWAMAVARMHGLDSMVEFLVDEGVGADKVYQHPSERNPSNWLRTRSSLFIPRIDTDTLLRQSGLSRAARLMM